MPNITIVNGSFCHLDTVVRHIMDLGAWRPVHTGAVIEDAAQRSGLSESKLSSVFYAKNGLLEPITRDKDRAAAWLKLSTADLLQKEGILMTGPAALLVPDTISHILRVCLISNLDHRIKTAADQKQISESEARKKIKQFDADLGQWSRMATGTPDPWRPELYDMLLPMEKMSPRDAALQITTRINSDLLKENPESQKKAADFLLEAQVGVALAEKGRHIEVHADGGRVTLTVNAHVLMFSRLEGEITKIARTIPGVLSVTVQKGAGFHKADIYRRHDFKLPARVLLVDDERKFVKTLSNRLIMRDLGASVAYDGPSALEMIEKEKPEVMVLDLKMPGMDGIEVLKIVREKYPEIAVVILTGHGSEMDKQICLGLGAVDYLHKPVSIDDLGRVLERAARKNSGQ